MAQTKITYYGSRISDNMVKTPEGFLICRNVPIARTGTQQYLGTEIGLNDREIHEVDRTENEVFSPATIASFEGKPFTDDHPMEEVTPDNANGYIKGTIHNVRRGKGEEAANLMADIIVYDSQVIREIENGKREVSCGYECLYEPTGYGHYMQTGIVGNHVALVEKGRAGDRVAIKDSMDNLIKEDRGTVAKHTKFWTKIFRMVNDNEPDQLEEAVDAMMESCNNLAGMIKPAKDEEEPKQAPQAAQMPPQAPMQAQPQPQAQPMPQQAQQAAQEPEQEEPEDNHYEERIARLERLVQRFVKGEGDKSAADSLEELENEIGGNAPANDTCDDDFSDESEEDYGDEEETAPEENYADGEEEEPEEDYEDEDNSAVIDDADPMPEEGGEEMPEEEQAPQMSVSDSLALIRAAKPGIARIRDKNRRKRVSDSLAKFVRQQMGRPAKSNTGAYAGIKKAGMHANDSATVDFSDLGKQWARKYNPHYKNR